MTSSKMCWLLLEDEPRLREALVEMFEVWGVLPLVFEDGEDAMAWLDEVEAGNIDSHPMPQLAMLDVRLPGRIQGQDVAARLRQVPQIDRCKLVMISAFRFSEEERRAIEDVANPDMFVNKPFPDLFEFKQQLDDLLSS